MGGRGAYIKTNKINLPSNVMTEEEYLRSKGYDRWSNTNYDILTTPTTMNESNRSRLEREAIARSQSVGLINKREELREEYQRKIKSGELRKPTEIEKSLQTAHGDSSLESVQAARRNLKRRGIDWKTGRKIKRSK